LPKVFIRSRSFLVESLGSENLRRGIIWLLPSLFESHFFLSLALLLWIGIPVLYWTTVRKWTPLSCSCL
jgi:hypothetical protein